MLFFYSSYSSHRDLHSFPTRRSSDLVPRSCLAPFWARAVAVSIVVAHPRSIRRRDRKSTRLNSSHTVISYAVFCLKKKKESEERAGAEDRAPRLGAERDSNAPSLRGG